LLLSPLIALIAVLAMSPGEGPSIAPSVPLVGVADELSKLVALRDAGHISEDEFQRQRARLLPPSPAKAAQPVGAQTQEVGAGMLCGMCGKPQDPSWRGACGFCKTRYSDVRPYPAG
jgi:hypothetical protein